MEIDVATVHRVLDGLGVERVERGLEAFGHEPTLSWCNCFATECFWPEITDVSPGVQPHFLDGGHELGSDSISSRIGVPLDDCSRVFATWYEHEPEELVGTVVDWLIARE